MSWPTRHSSEAGAFDQRYDILVSVVVPARHARFGTRCRGLERALSSCTGRQVRIDIVRGQRPQLLDGRRHRPQQCRVAFDDESGIGIDQHDRFVHLRDDAGVATLRFLVRRGVAVQAMRQRQRAGAGRKYQQRDAAEQRAGRADTERVHVTRHAGMPAARLLPSRSRTNT